MTYLAPKYGSPERAPQRAPQRTPRQPTASRTSLRTADGCLSRSGQQASPRPPRLRARLSASQCGQAIPDRVCTLFTCAGRSSALRCVPPVSAAAPCERLVPLRCCPPPASLCKNRLGGVLFSCIWFARLSLRLSCTSGGLLAGSLAILQFCPCFVDEPPRILYYIISPTEIRSLRSLISDRSLTHHDCTEPHRTVCQSHQSRRQQRHHHTHRVLLLPHE